ncbi:MAG: hypothetical protein VKQ33_08220 [Candidatus Sericytochromatia bacterium]|nr:hypothetical protein [Candidatus Sericytochromatia bacterium]
MSRQAARLTGLTALLVGAIAAPASAIQLGTSSTTGQSVVLLPVRSSGALVGPLGYTYGLRLGQHVGDMVGPTPANAGLREVGSLLADVDLALSYRWTLMDVAFLGRFNPTVAPFVGYRWLGALTAQATGPAGLVQVLTGQGGSVDAVASLAQLHGPTLGVGADTELPLGLNAFANAGLTVLTGGGWDNRRNGLTVTSAGQLATGHMVLPGLGAGASWSPLPGVTFSAGYDLLALPTALRSQAAALAPGLTWLRSWSVGVNILGWGF